MTILLLGATALSLISSCVPVIIKPFLACLFVEAKEERHLRNVVLQLAEEKANVSAVDEFAKYARIERKLNKAKEELKALATARMASHLKKKLSISYAVQILLGLLMIVLVWTYRSTPVIVLPYDLYPLGQMISWPTGVEGAVSITAWLLVTRTAMQAVVAGFKKT